MLLLNRGRKKLNHSQSMEKHCDWLSVCFRFQLLYHKILKKSPREYTFQRPFLRGLYTERNGALQNWLGLYTWRKICVSELTGLAYSWKKLYVRNFYITEKRLEEVDSF